MRKDTNRVFMFALGMALLFGWGGAANAAMPMVAAGHDHSVGLSSDGKVYVWGGDGDGQLGDDSATNRSATILVPGLIGVVAAVAAGDRHTLALMSDGSVWAWGRNDFGQLGFVTTKNRSSPLQVPGLSGVVAVAAGFGHSIAVKSNGSVWAWGSNDSGQLGDGTTTSRSSPAQVPGLTGVAAVAAGYAHSIAVMSDGSVRAWGGNNVGQLGDGTTTNRSSPVQVPGLTGVVVAVAAGYAHSIAVKSDGSVWAWGSNDSGQLGDGTRTNRSSPVQVPGLTSVVAVAVGDAHSIALKSDGSVWAWGKSESGELGDGTTTERQSPAQVPGLTGVVAVAGGGERTLTVRSDGSVSAWGNNDLGGDGDGTFAQRHSPVLVVNPSADGFLNLITGTVIHPPPNLDVPFFVVSMGGITATSASVSTTTKFNAADVGKSGAVFVTAMVPPGSLVPAQSPMNGLGTSGVSAGGAYGAASSALTAANPFVLIQLTSLGWQLVVNGQLIPYASGVLGDQVAAQTILNNTDTTNLLGAQFCLGYGISADQMIAAGTMRAVATIPDPNATSTATVNCIVGSYNLLVPPGWNLLGNSLNQTLSVASLFGDPNTVTTVWKWDAMNAQWQFYTPQMDATALQTYATGKGYGVLSVINPGEGYWVNAKSQPSLATQSGTSVNLPAANLVAGWNLVATGNDVTPSAFNTSLNAIPPAVGVNTLWAWDNPLSQWYFYAPSLEVQGGTALADYIASKSYLDFTQRNKTLGNGTGFWVNR